MTAIVDATITAITANAIDEKGAAEGPEDCGRRYKRVIGRSAGPGNNSPERQLRETRTTLIQSPVRATQKHDHTAN